MPQFTFYINLPDHNEGSKDVSMAFPGMEAVLHGKIYLTIVSSCVAGGIYQCLTMWVCVWSVGCGIM